MYLRNSLFFLLLCSCGFVFCFGLNESCICQSFFSKREVISSSHNKQVYCSYHARQGNRFLQKICNFRQATHDFVSNSYWNCRQLPSRSGESIPVLYVQGYLMNHTQQHAVVNISWEREWQLFLSRAQGAEESYLTVFLVKFIVQL